MPASQRPRMRTTPEAWLEDMAMVAERRQVPSGQAAGGECWLITDAALELLPGASTNSDGRLQGGVTWPRTMRRRTTPLPRAAWSAAFNGGEDARAEDGAALHVHHLCRQPRCVRPDHLEALDGRHNLAERTARKSMEATAEQVAEALTEAHMELARLQDHARELKRTLGRVRQERDDARAMVALESTARRQRRTPAATDLFRVDL